MTSTLENDTQTSTDVDWHHYFYYDESSPSFLRRATDCLTGKWHKILKHKIGDAAGHLTESNGYYSVTAEGKSYLAHRVIWEMFYGKIPDGFHIDHRDGDRLNNSISNLRCVPKVKNWRNCRKSLSNTSGVTGVNKKVNTREGGKSNAYWVASWQDLGGERLEKNFSVTKLGEEEAFRLACEYREKMIAELNAQGAGYTEDHGKRLAA